MLGNTKNIEKSKKTVIFTNNYLLQNAGVKTTNKVNISNLPKIIAKHNVILVIVLNDP